MQRRFMIIALLLLASAVGASVIDKPDLDALLAEARRSGHSAGEQITGALGSLSALDKEVLLQIASTTPRHDESTRMVVPQGVWKDLRD